VAATSQAAPGAGSGAIDAIIASLLERVEDVSAPELRAATAALENALTGQLAGEEEAMRAACYPLADGHEADHDLLLEEVRQILRLVEQADRAPAARRAAVREIATRFHAHVVAYDLGLDGFLRRSRAT
jgi:hemerythrin